MCHDHAPAAVPGQLQGIKSLSANMKGRQKRFDHAWVKKLTIELRGLQRGALSCLNVPLLTLLPCALAAAMQGAAAAANGCDLPLLIAVCQEVQIGIPLVSYHL
jgi:hypothetical protein